MNKQMFLFDLRNALSGLPQDDIEERIAFYNEMIDDRMEEGMSEEEAVAGVGTVDEIRAQIISDIPFPKLVKETIRPKRNRHVWELVLIILGFPVWFPLMVAAGAIVFALYIVAWALIVSLWAIEVALWACALGGSVAATIYFMHGNTIPALMMFGAVLFVIGLSIFMFFGCTAASRGIIKLTKKAGLGIKSMFIRKEYSE